MTTLLVIFLALAYTSNAIGSSECFNEAFNAAKAIHSISKNSKESSFNLISTEISERYFWQGEDRHAIQVHLKDDENLSPVYEVNVISKSCVILDVSFLVRNWTR